LNNSGYKSVNTNVNTITMKKRIQNIISVLVLILFGYSSVSGQTHEVEISTDELRDISVTERIPVKQQTEVRGSPYLFDQLQTGIVTLKDGRVTEEIPLRYNIYEKRIEYDYRNSVLVIQDENIEEFLIKTPAGSHRFVKGYDSSRLGPEDFVHLIVDGKVQFLAKYSINFHENLPSYGQATQIDEYVENVTYYVKDESGDVNRLRSLNERRVLRNVMSHSEELRNFASQNNIDFSNPEDLIGFFNHYNSLLADS